jgi:TrmH family RNA methyltransferase
VLLVTDTHADTPVVAPALDYARACGAEILIVSRDIQEKISGKENAQTVLGVFPMRWHDLPRGPCASSTFYIALDRTQNLGNLGTIIRTADAVGANGVILIGDTCDPFAPEAVRATMGSIFAVPMIKTTEAGLLAWRPTWQGQIVGTSLQTTHDYRTAPYQRPLILLMGQEQAGLSPTLRPACDLLVKMPMRGRADSLNLAVATGIMAYAIDHSSHKGDH